MTYLRFSRSVPSSDARNVSIVILMFTKNPQVHGYTIVAFPQRSIPKGIESMEGMVGLTCEGLLQ
jgi:hypothetical protein